MRILEFFGAGDGNDSGRPAPRPRCARVAARSKIASCDIVEPHYVGSQPNTRLRTFTCIKVLVERVMGIEPTSSAWEAEALPLDDTRVSAEILPGLSHLPGLQVRQSGF